MIYSSLSILILVILLLAQAGAIFAWTSPFLVQLTSSDSYIPLDLNEASWMASITNIGRFPGAIIGALCINFWGSKNAVFLTLVIESLGWLFLLATNQVLMLYICRLLSSIGLGMTFSCFPLYIGEIAHPQIRGAIVTFAFCGSFIGQIAVNVIGTYLSVSIGSIVLLIPCLLNIALFIWLPNSPHYLVKIGDFEGAKKAINWYRNGDGVEEELDSVQNFVLSSNSKNFTDKMGEFRRPYVAKALIVTMVLFVLMQISGINVIIIYMETILIHGKIGILSSSMAVTLLFAIGALTSLATSNLIDSFGRRPLLLASSLGVGISMLMLGTHFLLIDYDIDPSGFQGLLIGAASLFMIAVSIGLMPVPSTVLSEIFPTNIRNIASCLASMLGGIVGFAVTKAYQTSVDTIGEAYVFYINAAMIFSAVPFVLFYMPETKGKTLTEIQELLMKT